MLWQLVVAAVAAWLVLNACRRRRVLALAAQLPTVKGTPLPLLGHMYMLMGNDEDRMNVLMGWGRDVNEKGGIGTFWFGRQMLTIVSDAACAEVVLKSCLEKYDLVTFLKEVTENGLIFADVNIWRPRRKIMTRVFTPKNLEHFVDIFNEQSQVLVKQLRKNADRKAFSVWNYVTSYAMDAVCESTLGVKVLAQLNSQNTFLVAFNKASQLMADRICQPWLQPEMVYRRTKHFVDMEKYKKLLLSFVENIIKNTKNKVKDDKKQETYNGSEVVDKKESFKTFLDMLIENSGGAGGYTDLELREETLVIAIAGTDTSAVGACFTLCTLARFPHVQEKVYEEIMGVLGTSDKPIDHSDLPRLKYLDAVVKECLRLNPPVPIIVRKPEKDVTLPSGHTLVPGMGVVIPIWGIHRNPRYWGADADHFRPERFLVPLSHPAAFLPFSYGPRNCIGYLYAMMSMKTAVASVVRAYHVLPPVGAAAGDCNFRFKFEIMMKDVDGFQLRLEKR